MRIRHGEPKSRRSRDSIDTTSGEAGGCTLSSCKVDGIAFPYFYYDADGNMLCVTTKTSCDQTAAHNYSWTSFDMAATIQSGATNVGIGYTPEHQRGALSSSGSATLYYFANPAGGVVEEQVPGAAPTWHTYVAPYGHIVAEAFSSSGTINQMYYLAPSFAEV